MNEHDSEIMAGLLIENGYVQASSRDEADIVIFNTCSIRENADKRFFGTLGQLKHRKEQEKENFTVCVCGCMMQQQHITDTLKAKYPWVDVVCGTHNFHELPKLLENLYTEKKKQFDIWPDGGITENLPAERLFRHKSFVNIMYGCNNFCSYCIVPYTRGRERSRRPQDILREVHHLSADGVREITLLGQNVNSYKGEEADFTDLIYMLAEVEGIERIRFMTSHPKDLSDKLIGAFRDCDKLCKYIHLPVQSGSDAVLKAMNRKYDRKRYFSLVEKLRDAVPDIAISTDIIVGFPGETEKDFEDTLDLAERVGYDSAFTFLYSMREGTPAAKSPDQIPEDIKHSRFNRLVDVINKSAASKNAGYIGSVKEVLVDGRSRNGSSAWEGRTDSFKLVNFHGRDGLEGKLVKVRITGANTFSLTGEIAQ
ncbi:MAG TPA: tRNA (N6-isopentenyl adenosine(37)-C2)-methylthiotransferase MiaB [Candidatus Fimisoma avicola]|uniref:tRNA-2-methylthio-N(6)-dimethylallyladenosine synthase n=1 Tax=Candidatus Fimisoma avicola TaxID=2840826 RepID=A0A9D1I2F0_9FIRM|nr:tRNA (N6-isopentenyl adenosine(37)-C2)-methylthiotransferase MiaB [Candidatus Fimisoma avicola]